MVKRGIVDCILSDGKVTVTPFGGGIVSPPLTVPDSLSGILSVGTAVWYVTDGNTGIVLCRLDGKENCNQGGSESTENGNSQINALPAPLAAEVGQFITVAAIDELGVVTATDAVTLERAEEVAFG